MSVAWCPATVTAAYTASIPAWLVLAAEHRDAGAVPTLTVETTVTVVV